MSDSAAIIVIAEATALPGKEAELRQAIDAVISPSLAEDGVSIFRLHQDLDAPGHFVLYERFADQTALDWHFATSHFKKVVDDVAPLVVGGKPKITKLHQLTE
jgi:quinol monooxygenase YgiN